MSEETLAAGSIQEYVTGDIRERQAQEIEKIAVPKFNGRLLLRCQGVDPKTLIRMGIDAESNPDPVEGVISAAVEALLAASVGSETTIDGETHDLGMPLGIELADYLGLIGAQTPQEAVYLIFEDESEIVEAAGQLKKFQQLANKRVSESIVGNSEAAA